MVKHLAIPQKAVRPVALPKLEGGQPEVTASITQARFEGPTTVPSPVTQSENK
jgi:hypothetical protein